MEQNIKEEVIDLDEGSLEQVTAPTPEPLNNPMNKTSHSAFYDDARSSSLA